MDHIMRENITLSADNKRKTLLILQQAKEMERRDKVINKLNDDNDTLRAELSVVSEKLKVYETAAKKEIPVKLTGVVHRVKTGQPHYDDSESGKKTFVIIENNRDYAVGDILHMFEWTGKKVTGRFHRKVITYVVPVPSVPYASTAYTCLAVTLLPDIELSFEK